MSGLTNETGSDRETGDSGTAPPAHTSKPWIYFAFGASVLSSLTIILVGLLMLFWNQRLANLRPQTEYYSAQVIQALQDQYVPAEAIEEEPAEERSDRQSLWNYRVIRAKLPSHLNAEGIQRLVERRMSEFSVQVVARPVVPEGHALSMMLGPYEFATLTLLQAPAPVEEQLDVRDVASRIGQDLQQYLESAGIPRESVAVSEPEEREDSRARWTQTRVDIVLPQSISAGELRGRLGELLGLHGVEIIAPSNAPQALQLQLKGLPIASIFAAPTPGSTPARPLQVDLAPAMEAAPAPPETAALLDPAVTPDASAPPEPAQPATGNGFTGGGALSSPPRLAIILDDGGNVWARSEEVLALDNRLTLAILPLTTYAQQTAEAALTKGFEVMLHMPMETINPSDDPGPGKIMIAMNAEEIREKTEAALASVPGVRGVNNHTGSLYTADRQKMQEFLAVLKEKELFFVDSRTHASSQGYQIAQDLGVLSAQRDIFLDNDRSQAAIRAQFEALLDVAKSNGQAIGIGHFYQETAAVLTEAIPRLDEMGIQLVHASELVH
ncbi:MAG: divergent polysaccharide deacetylase family protein [Candidatus Hydrogenedentes bacterium]|nr:divergent polysaccharide deacetylase family protein [Candidatus Hydrogenedentota bacterium]